MAGKLKPLDVERETRPGKYADGDGLYLIVNGATSKNWICRYCKGGKERWLGLGSVKDVSLKERAACSRCSASSRQRRSQHARRRHRAGEASGARGSESRRDQGHSAHLRAARQDLHSRALVDLEQQAPQSMAVVAQTLRLCDDRKTHDPGDQAQPHLRIDTAGLG